MTAGAWAAITALFDEPVFRLRAGLAIQGLVLDEYVQLGASITLLDMDPHLVLIAARVNVALQPSLSLPRTINCIDGRASVELSSGLPDPDPHGVVNACACLFPVEHLVATTTDHLDVNVRRLTMIVEVAPAAFFMNAGALAQCDSRESKNGGHRHDLDNNAERGVDCEHDCLSGMEIPAQETCAELRGTCSHSVGRAATVSAFQSRFLANDPVSSSGGPGESEKTSQEGPPMASKL